MKKDIDKILHEIAFELNKSAEEVIDKPPTLMGGTMGVALFLLNYHLRYGDDGSLRNVFKIIEHALVKPANSNPSLATGLSGMLFAYEIMGNAGIFQKQDSFYEHLYSILLDESKEYCKKNNFDLLHGLIGIGVYIANQEQKKSVSKILNEITELIFDMVYVEKEYSYWVSKKTFNQDQDTIDLGFAHGISSVIAFLSLMYAKGIKVKETKYHITQSVNFLFFIKKGHFPSHVDLETFEHLGPDRSRLAWCYGDMGIAWAIWNCGNTLKNVQWKQFAIDMFNNMKDRKLSNAGTVDASLCHGTMGIAYMFYRMHKNTGVYNYLDTCNYWLKQTVIRKKSKNGLEGLFFYYKNKMVKDLGLLTGLAGIDWPC